MRRKTTKTTLYSWWGFMYGLMMGSLIWKCGSCFEFEHSQPLPLQDWNTNVTYKAAASSAFTDAYVHRTPPLMVGLTLVNAAASKGAVCLDGSLPGYHIHRGYGSGANSWLIHLEGGGWCNSITKCVFSKKTRHGSSHYMEKQIPFEGILSNKAEENPGHSHFYNWNRVKVRYCDGGSFSGDSQNEHNSILEDKESGQLLFSLGVQLGVWHLYYIATNSAIYFQALLESSVLVMLVYSLTCKDHEILAFSLLIVLPISITKLRKSLACRLDISGWRTLRYMFAGVVMLQGMQKNLPRGCAKRFNPMMIQVSLAPASADHHGYWNGCRKNYARCTESQISFLQGFRNQMLYAVKGFSRLKKNGLYINSCFAHCQTERQDTWFSPGSPHIKSKGIAESVGNWYFDRAVIMAIDCPYPCDHTCHHLVFK
ncbi:hypothetical protein SADUNF_Sadunf10G0003600 [Salix dunnii]|uniref:Pectin acetylesterase n=1 Tax=Salix dunnii TaxID=1413687 RepID=A0A835MXJ9_9ROSI|nr:hypothetical protein SADUNF_Sadunf10G0003600 [Salix dunnii]